MPTAELVVHDPAEDARLAALRALEILDTEPEDLFDRLTAAAATAFQAPVALISLIDLNRQWFKSCFGDVEEKSTPRDIAFCDHTIRRPEVMVVPDALADARFRDNPLVTGGPRIRFYAGAPLTSADGQRLGSLCIIDFAPRDNFSEADRVLLANLAGAVSAAMTLRRDVSAFVELEKELQAADAELREQQALLTFLTDHSADLILRVAPSAEILWASQSARRFGYAPEELVGRNSAAFIHPDDAWRLAERSPDRFADLKDPTGPNREYRVRRKDGGWIWIEESPTIIRGPDGRATEIVNVLRDVSDRKRAEQVAADIQAGMLLSREALAALTTRAEVDAVLLPARNVGGDLYDAFLVAPDRLCFLIGDVTGKGVAASLFMALAKALSHSVLLRLQGDLGAAFAAISQELSRNNGQAMALSLLVGVVDLETGAMRLCCAGHEDPLVVAADGTVRVLDLAGGPPLCTGEGYGYVEETAVLGDGETLVALTDGVAEALNPDGELFGRDRVAKALAAAATEPLTAAVDGLVTAVRTFEAGREPSDDLAVLAVRRR